VSSQILNHEPVMMAEVMQHLNFVPDGVYVDGTYGRGGHSQSILQSLGANGQLIVMDKDPQAIESASLKLGQDARVTILHEDFSNLADILAEMNLLQSVDGVLLDLGVSSPQLDDASRGFSFQKNGPLDMRMNPQQGESAARWLGRAEEEEISKVLWELGEERFARRIARKIVETRRTQNIDDTKTLSDLISGCVPQPKNRKHPATRSFQAIRIHINQELAYLGRLLDSIFNVLKVGGRLLVISFHSLEDRMVKRFLRLHSSKPKIPRGLPVAEKDLVSGIRLRLIGKAMRAGVEELTGNPRARSAILRVAERVV
jgi:16S rRNA (cytosine1402-N4)-methyltransferase